MLFFLDAARQVWLSVFRKPIQPIKIMPRPSVVKDGKKFNLYLPTRLQEESADIAKDRYGISFSMLVARLLVQEKRSKKGLCHAHPKEITN